MGVDVAGDGDADEDGDELIVVGCDVVFSLGLRRGRPGLVPARRSTSKKKSSCASIVRVRGTL